MHLSPEFGLTYKEIEAEGFHIDKKVEMLLSSDTANGTVKSMGLATIGFADALDDLRPDLVVILGDRFEMLAAAQACMIFKIPIAHIGGGEITEGAYDDSIRHAITKLSHLHFASTEEYCQRIIQMGEQPSRVFWSGSLGADNITNEETMDLEELQRSIDFKLGEKFLLITFHPVTMENHTAKEQCRALLKALEIVNNQYQLLFTLPNSDTDGRIIIELIKEFVDADHSHRFAITSLGKKRYYAAMKYCSAVIGNSSSGISEAPSYHIPTLNIGDRQKGRTRSASVIDCEANYDAIKKGLKEVLSEEVKKLSLSSENPYYRDNTANLIFNQIKSYPIEGLEFKHFYDIK